jgi:heat shock protein HspQ
VFKFEIGARVRDTITGYSGVVTGRAQYVSGVNRYQVEAVDSTGRPCEWWLDGERCEVVAQ